MAILLHFLSLKKKEPITNTFYEHNFNLTFNVIWLTKGYYEKGLYAFWEYALSIELQWKGQLSDSSQMKIALVLFSMVQ